MRKHFGAYRSLLGKSDFCRVTGSSSSAGMRFRSISVATGASLAALCTSTTCTCTSTAFIRPVQPAPPDTSTCQCSHRRRHLGPASSTGRPTSSLASGKSPNYATQHKIASSIAKGERRAQERQANQRQLCPGCRRPPNLCVCSVLRSVLPRAATLRDDNDDNDKNDSTCSQAVEVVKLATQTQICILQHPNEFRKRHFSTVPLIALALQDVTIRVGYEFNSESLLDSLGIHDVSAATASDDEGSAAQRPLPLLLFPGEDATDLDAHMRRQKSRLVEKNGVDRSSSDQRNLLILIDGTWAEAKRMARNSPNLLKRCQMVQFPPDSMSSSSCIANDDESCDERNEVHHQSVYNAVRREPEAHTISTLEALAKALDMLEPDAHASSALNPSEVLNRVLEKHVEAYLNNAITKRTPRFNRDISGVGTRNKRTWQIKNDLFPDGTSKSEEQDAVTHVAGFRTLADGAIIRPLQIADAPQLDAWWDHKSPTSLQMVVRCISSDRNANVGACLGIYEPGGRKLRAGIVRYEGGAVGMLHVDPQHRRRGYGKALLSEATRAIEKAAGTGECVAFIMEGNVASEKTFQKVGWVREDPSLKGTGKRKANRKWIKKCS